MEEKHSWIVELLSLGSGRHFIAGYRRNMVGSLHRGMPKVVDCRQTDAQATNKSPRTRTWSSSSIIKSGKERVSSHFIILTTDKCCCVVGSNSCSAGLEAEVTHL